MRPRLAMLVDRNDGRKQVVEWVRGDRPARKVCLRVRGSTRREYMPERDFLARFMWHPEKTLAGVWTERDLTEMAIPPTVLPYPVVGLADPLIRQEQKAMVTVALQIGKGYIGDLVKRLKAAGISHNALAREMGISPSQLSRWTNKHVEPRMAQIEKIEKALLRIEKKRARQTAKQGAKQAELA